MKSWSVFQDKQCENSIAIRLLNFSSLYENQTNISKAIKDIQNRLNIGEM